MDLPNRECCFFECNHLKLNNKLILQVFFHSEHNIKILEILNVCNFELSYSMLTDSDYTITIKKLICKRLLRII